MIGSFWNLCRACPSMPIDKLHSEYRSTYTWHEYTGPHQETTVVRRAPQPLPNPRPTLEPPLPRRKKCPELAYKHHEFISSANGGGIDAVDTNLVADKVREITSGSTLPASQLSKAISRISTEYRLQFAWPRRNQLTNGETIAQLPAAGGAGGTAGGPPRKSLSMGALKQGIGQTGPVPVHIKKRPGDLDHKRDGIQKSELEPLFNNNSDTIDGIVPESEERDEDLNDLKLAFRSATKEEKDKENTRKIAPVTNTMLPAGRPSSVQARPISGILQEDFKTDNERAMARARKDFLIRHHLDRTTGVGDGALLPSPTREKLEPVVSRRRDDAKETRDEIQPKSKSSPKNSPRTGRSQSLGPLSRSPKRQTPRAVSKDAKEKEKESKDKELRDKSGEPVRHPRPTFLATTASPHRPLHHHAKPSTTTTTTTTSSSSSTTTTSTNQMNTLGITKVPLVKNANVNGNSGTSSTISSVSVLASGSKSLLSMKNTKNNKKQSQQIRAQGSARTNITKNTESSINNHDQSYEANAALLSAMTAEPQVNGNMTGGDCSTASTPLSQTVIVPSTAVITTSPWFDDEPVVKSPPEPTRVKSPEQMMMRSPEPVNWTVPLDTGKTFTVTQNVREGELLTRPHSEAKTWTTQSKNPSAPQSAPPELVQHKSQNSGYKSPESESVSLGSFSGLNGHKDLDSERDSPLPSNIQEPSTTTQSDKEIVAMTEESSKNSAIKPVAGTNLRCLEDPIFEFERGKTDSEAVAAVAVAASAAVPRTGYHVLEAEDTIIDHDGGNSGGTSSSYHVLEAPNLSSSSGQRSATDVLEMARDRFDKFWGKGGPDNQA